MFEAKRLEFHNKRAIISENCKYLLIVHVVNHQGCKNVQVQCDSQVQPSISTARQLSHLQSDLPLLLVQSSQRDTHAVSSISIGCFPCTSWRCNPSGILRSTYVLITA